MNHKLVYDVIKLSVFLRVKPFFLYIVLTDLSNILLNILNSGRGTDQSHILILATQHPKFIKKLEYI